MSDELNIEFEGELICDTDMAYLFNIEDKEVWLPISQIQHMEKVAPPKGELTEWFVFEIPEWLAYAKDLI
jgi:hypothetical protein